MFKVVESGISNSTEYWKNNFRKLVVEMDE